MSAAAVPLYGPPAALPVSRGPFLQLYDVDAGRLRKRGKDGRRLNGAPFAEKLLSAVRYWSQRRGLTFLSGYPEIRGRLRCSKATVTRALAELGGAGCISWESTGRGLEITYLPVEKVRILPGESTQKATGIHKLTGARQATTEESKTELTTTVVVKNSEEVEVFRKPAGLATTAHGPAQGKNQNQNQKTQPGPATARPMPRAEAGAGLAALVAVDPAAEARELGMDPWIARKFDPGILRRALELFKMRRKRNKIKNPAGYVHHLAARVVAIDAGRGYLPAASGPAPRAGGMVAAGDLFSWRGDPLPTTSGNSQQLPETSGKLPDNFRTTSGQLPDKPAPTDGNGRERTPTGAGPSSVLRAGMSGGEEYRRWLLEAERAAEANRQKFPNRTD